MVRKGGIAFNKQFLLFSQCFLPYLVLIFHFKCTLKGCLQFVSIWDQSKISSSGNGLSIDRKKIFGVSHIGSVPRKHFQL